MTPRGERRLPRRLPRGEQVPAASFEVPVSDQLSAPRRGWNDDSALFRDKLDLPVKGSVRMLAVAQTKGGRDSSLRRKAWEASRGRHGQWEVGGYSAKTGARDGGSQMARSCSREHFLPDLSEFHIPPFLSPACCQLPPLTARALSRAAFVSKSEREESRDNWGGSQGPGDVTGNNSRTLRF